MPLGNNLTRYSHTPNISDSGERDGNYSRSNSIDTITIPGADRLRLTITYGTEYGWDMLYVFQEL